MGGAIVQILKANIEYINRRDAGRLLQSAFHYNLWKNSTTPNDYNPTEAGDWLSSGSPLINFNIDNTSKRIYTRANTLLWGQPGTTADLQSTSENPILSGTEIGKDLSVINSNQMRYISWTVFGKDFPSIPTNQIGDKKIEIATAYLNPIFDSVGIYYWKNGRYVCSQKNALSDLGDWGGIQKSTASNFSWADNLSHSAFVVVWSNDRTKAFALLTKRGSLINDLQLSLYRVPGTVNGAIGFKTEKLTIGKDCSREAQTAGQQYLDTTYVLVGTVAQVSAQVNNLTR